MIYNRFSYVRYSTSFTISSNMRQRRGKSCVLAHPLCSLALPLDEGFVLPTNRKHALTVFAELHANHMLTVASIAARATSVSVSGNGVVEYINKTKVVCSHDGCSVRGKCEVVNVSVVYIVGFASRDVGFTLLDGVRCPFKLGGSSHAVRILLFGLNAIEETFMATIG
jgi:hypothetical protein